METAQRQLGVSGLSSNLVTSGWQESGNDEPSPHFGLFYLGYNIVTSSSWSKGTQLKPVGGLIYLQAVHGLCTYKGNLCRTDKYSSPSVQPTDEPPNIE